MFSITIWLMEEYYLFSYCLVGISILSVSLSLYTTRKNTMNVKEQAQFSCTLNAYRYIGNAEEVEKRAINSTALVPGDIIGVPQGEVIPCDAIMIQGSCVMNESMLTGESIPAIKQAIPANTDEAYDARTDNRYTLFGGTKVLQLKTTNGQEPLALVIRTGFQTTKGSLIRDILFPKSAGRFNFQRDSLLYIVIFAILSFIGFLLSIHPLMEQGFTGKDLIIKSLVLITITVPPTLPAAMTIGTAYSLFRL